MIIIVGQRRRLARNMRKSARRRIRSLCEQQNGLCYLCDRPMRLDLIGVHINHALKPTIDHVLDLEYGGDNEPDNLMACCNECNNKKAHLKNKERTLGHHKCACRRCGELKTAGRRRYCLICISELDDSYGLL